MIVLWIPGSHPDWRGQAFYRASHWTRRAAIAHEAHAAVWAIVLESLGCEIEPFPGPVHITITEFAAHPPDADNVPCKVIIDGLRASGLLEDDTPAYVASVTLRSRRPDHRGPGLGIEIVEAERGLS